MGMTPNQADRLREVLHENFVPSAEFHHGDCRGADVEAASIAWSIGFFIHCHPPINPKNRGWFARNHCESSKYDYILRDQHIVEQTGVLIATPHTDYEVRRSGTWTTVRYARNLKRPVVIIPPNGKPYVEKTNSKGVA